MYNKSKLIRVHLDKTLSKFRPLASSPIPVKGWIRAIRDALGMNGRQMADRLGEHRSYTAQIERREMTGAITLASMKKVAQALDCTFVYGFVPHKSLEETVHRRARKVVEKHLVHAAHSMRLEGQASSPEENHDSLERMTEELLRESPSHLWDE